MLQLLVLVAIGLFLWRLLAKRGRDRGLEKCVGCRYQLRTDADGTLCGLDDKQVFKNRIQVSWCQNRATD